MLRVEGADLKLVEAVFRRGVEGAEDVFRAPVAVAEELVPDVVLLRPEPRAIREFVFSRDLPVALRVRDIYGRTGERVAVFHVCAHDIQRGQVGERRGLIWNEAGIQEPEKHPVLLLRNLRKQGDVEKIRLDLLQPRVDVNLKPGGFLHALWKFVPPLNLLPFAAGEE